MHVASSGVQEGRHAFRERWRQAIENPFYAPEVHGPYELFSLGDFVLEEGYTLRDCKPAYTTFGELDEAMDNAILVTTWYSGTHQIWHDVYIGPEHALNPDGTLSWSSTRSATASDRHLKDLLAT